MKIPFQKMSAHGNEFVVLDARKGRPKAAEIAEFGCEQIKKIACADNATTKGCDQVLVVSFLHEVGNWTTGQYDGIIRANMKVFNADGGEVKACGNGTMAIVYYLHDFLKLKIGQTWVIEIGGYDFRCTSYPLMTGGDLESSTLESFEVEVEMLEPKFGWQEIPCAETISDTSQFPLHPDLPPAFLVNVGNPHAVFLFENEGDPLSAGGDNIRKLAKEYGKELVRHEIFEDGANINFARIEPAGQEKRKGYHWIDLVTWERGAETTKSCGTGSYATAIAANKMRGIDFPMSIAPGGRDKPKISRSDGKLFLSGFPKFEFEGELEL